MAVSDPYRAYVKKEKRRLKSLPYFAESEEKQRAFLVLFDELDRHEDERRAFEAVLRWEANACSDPIYRVLALDYLRHRAADGPQGAEEWPETKLEESAVVHGDLHVRGNLVNAAGLVVLGALRVDGAYVTDGDYPCLAVGGALESREFFAAEAEVIALGGVQTKGTFWLSYNHTVVVTPLVEANTVCTADAHISGEVRAEHRYADGAIPHGALFGLEGDDLDDYEVNAHVAAHLLGLSSSGRSD